MRVLTCVRPLRRSGLAAALVLGLTMAEANLAAQDKTGPKGAAKSVTDTGLLRREAPGKPWQLVAQGESLPPGQLILGGGGAALESADGAVRVSLLGDMDAASPFPVIETAVTLGTDKDVDLDFTLERGRVDVVNQKKSGSARVRARIRGNCGDLILKEPGTRVALEIYGRWPRGTRFNKDPKPGEGPTLAFIIVVLKGEVELDCPVRQLTLKAPPGPALLEGNGIDDLDPSPVRLDKLPDWAANPGTSERAQKVKATIARFRKLAKEKSVSEAAAELVKSDDPVDRRTAVFILAATDDLDQFRDVLFNAKHRDVWENGVIAMRNWIGREPGQDQKLYRRLVDVAKYPPAQAEIVLNLLHSFGEEDLARPETYEALIDYLQSDKLPIRGLAAWHLVRLVPKGKAIGYDPLASKEERDKAVAAWRALVPSGKLPPRPTATSGKESK
jgi:hypothetical protein